MNNKQKNKKSKKVIPQHPYGTRSKTRVMAILEDDVEQKHKELREEVTLMKAQIGQMMQLLQSMEAGMHQDDISPWTT
ncbi:hypothetical protein CR513_09240, partial [Mucuna pruriens]